MLNRVIIYFFLLFHPFPAGIKATSHKPSFLVNMVNHTQAGSDRSMGRIQKPMEDGQFKCKSECLTTNEVGTKLVSRVQARFIDTGDNDSSKEPEMEAPSSKFSLFNLLTDNEEEDVVDEEKDDGDEHLGEEEYDGSVDDDFNFFGSEETKPDKLEGTKDDSFLKQYHRHPLRMHNLMFPLLLAYKLKFFTVIPLLLGSLVLLVGTTGVAGFFFALFAAALAITTKSHGSPPYDPVPRLSFLISGSGGGKY